MQCSKDSQHYKALSDLLLNNICEEFNGKIVGDGKNAEATSSAYRQATQIHPAIGLDGSSGPSVGQVPNAYSSGVGVVIGEFSVGGQPDRTRVGVGNQSSSLLASPSR
ncbi:hypothetical protein Tco_0761915 [Tanacetum coccineum]